MPALTPAQFRTQLPAFADATAYPDSVVQPYAVEADQLVSEERWGDLRDRGMAYYIAHHMVLEGMQARAVAAGGLLRPATGAIASEGGESVNVSYDVSGASEDGAGHWNQTQYGRQYWRLSRLMGAGPVQTPAGTPAASIAWPGFIYPV